jgi:hypothetical protein
MKKPCLCISRQLDLFCIFFCLFFPLFHLSSK